MLESLNQIVINLFNAIPFELNENSFLFLSYFLLVSGIWLENKSSEHSDFMDILSLFFLVGSLSLNILYSFYLTPEHFIWITKVLIFFFPYVIVYLFFWYIKKFKRN